MRTVLTRANKSLGDSSARQRYFLLEIIPLGTNYRVQSSAHVFLPLTPQSEGHVSSDVDLGGTPRHLFLQHSGSNPLRSCTSFPCWFVHVGVRQLLEFQIAYSLVQFGQDFVHCTKICGNRLHHAHHSLELCLHGVVASSCRSGRA